MVRYTLITGISNSICYLALQMLLYKSAFVNLAKVSRLSGVMIFVQLHVAAAVVRDTWLLRSHHCTFAISSIKTESDGLFCHSINVGWLIHASSFFLYAPEFQ